MRRAAALLAAVALAGCSLEPRYVRPELPVPPSWPVGDAYLRQTEAALPSISYRDIFRDPQLQAIIEQALANNQDVRVALANVAAARAQYRVARASILPEIDGIGRIGISRSGTTTSTIAGGSTTGSSGTTGTGTTGTGTGTTGTGTTGTGTTGTGTTGTTGTDTSGGTTTGGSTATSGGTVVTSSSGHTTTYSLQAGLSSFEVDLFGRLRSLSNAALQTYLGTEAAVRAARLSLVGEVASAYLTLATDRSLLAIAIDTEKSAGRSVDLTRARLTGGIAPRSDLRQAQTVLAQAQADRADLVALVAQDRNALELLVGAPVADARLPASIESVDNMLGELPPGLDSRILLRRPDVVQAEYTLRGANARIGAARAAFFPMISLTAVAGLASTALTSLFTGGAFTWSVAPTASLPLFDGGVNRGNLAYARAQRDLAVAEYARAIQTAFREVADALARRGTIDNQLAAQQLLASSAQDNFALADARYREGIDTFLTSLDAQRTLYSARRSLASARLIRADNLVELYRTIGGDMLVDTLPPPRGP